MLAKAEFLAVAITAMLAGPALTGEQVLDRSVAASGGREALERVRSYELEATIEMPGRGVRGTLAIRAKAPDKLVVVRTIEKVGTIRHGYDGASGWSEDPYNGVRRLAGEELEIARRGALFNADLRWRELYERAELTGVEKLDGRDVYVVRLTSKDGLEETRSYDAGTFLLVRTAAVYEGKQGRLPIETRFEDYRDVDGLKVAFLWRQTTPVGETTIRVTAVRHNAEIRDAEFAQP